MKIDQHMVGLLIWAVLLSCGFVALIVFGVFPILNDIISGKNIGIIFTLLSLTVTGYFVGNGFKKRCERKVILSGRRINCASEGMAAFMMFMGFSTILLVLAIGYYK